MHYWNTGQVESNFSCQQNCGFVFTSFFIQLFFRRDKTLNYFSIMLRKRLKNSDGTEDADEPEEKTKRKKASKSLVSSSLLLCFMNCIVNFTIPKLPGSESCCSGHLCCFDMKQSFLYNRIKIIQTSCEVITRRHPFTCHILSHVTIA